MANNLTKAGVRAGVPLLFFIAGILTAATATAQRIDKYYSSATQENGTLYYILPSGGFANGATSLTYDITYLSSADSARLSFTYTENGEFAIDSVALLYNDGSRIAAPATKLFIEPAKRRFKYRYSAMFSYSALSRFFAQQQPPVISLCTPGISHTDGATGYATGHADLRMKRKAWAKRAAITNRIFQVIALNRK